MTVEQFVMRELGFSRGFGPHSFMGFDDKDGLVAGVIFHNYCPESGVMELTAASRSRRWLTKSRLLEIFDYPFEQAKCRLALARISEYNATARKIWKSLGSTEYVIPELRAPHVAEVVCILTADAWQEYKHRMRGNHGQAIRTRAA